MIKICVKSNTVRKEIVTEVTNTPAQALEEANVGTAGTMVSLNGAPLTVTELNTPFENLGVGDGAVANLTAVVKADGAQH